MYNCIHIIIAAFLLFYSDAQAKDFFVKDRNGAEFKGWCWSGDSSYLDFTKPEVRYDSTVDSMCGSGY